MKITRDIFLKATAEAMNRESTKKLFKAESHAFDMFSQFAYAVFNRLEGIEVTEDSFHETVAEVLVRVTPDKISDRTMIINLSFIIFSLQIWEELEKLDKTEGDNPDESDVVNPEYYNFKTELNSKLT